MLHISVFVWWIRVLIKSCVYMAYSHGNTYPVFKQEERLTKNRDLQCEIERVHFNLFRIKVVFFD